jgi:catechol-2,3-dioxygenase
MSSAHAKADSPLCHGLDQVHLSEIVLKTSRFEAMRNWYVDALGKEPFLERNPEQKGGKDGKFLRASDVRLCFIRLHMQFPHFEYLGIFEVPNLKSQGTSDAGLHHVQFRHSSLKALFERYERLKSGNVRPHRTANHGPGTSFYYFDPDGNNVEFSAPNFKTEVESLAFFESEGFRNNPSGIEIDADAYVDRFNSGVPQAELVRI